MKSTPASGFPAVFAIRREIGYKLYTNKMYKNPENDHYISVIGTVTNAALDITYEYSPQETRYYTVSRKWCGGPLIPCEWSFTGIEFSAIEEGSDRGARRVPLIYIATQIDCLFPLGSTIVKPNPNRPIPIPKQSMTERAAVFNGDPYGARPVVEEATKVAPYVMPAHIKEVIIANSMSKKETCVISFNDITQDTASITSCGHVFDRLAITRWLAESSSNDLCPLCKQKCHLV
jgi:hypothetical protein